MRHPTSPIPDAALWAWAPASAPEAQALIRAVRHRASGVVDDADLPSPPEFPTSCCGRGCNGCVWEGYYNALAYWRDEVLLRCTS